MKHNRRYKNAAVFQCSVIACLVGAMPVTKTTRKIATKMNAVTHGMKEMKDMQKAMKDMKKDLKVMKVMKSIKKDDKDKKTKKDMKTMEEQLDKLFSEEPDLVYQLNNIPKGAKGSVDYTYPGFIASIAFDHDRRGNLRINMMDSSIEPM